jgi:hypothetical protein
VRALQKDPVDARLFELVDIFSHGSLDAYTSYYSRNDAYLKELGVDHEKSVETMRLLTLCSLASANHVASYESIASALQVRSTHFPPYPAPPLMTTLNSSFVIPPRPWRQRHAIVCAGE